MEKPEDERVGEMNAEMACSSWTPGLCALKVMGSYEMGQMQWVATDYESYSINYICAEMMALDVMDVVLISSR